MVDTFRRLFISFMLLSLIVFSFFSFGFFFQQENDAEDPFMSNNVFGNRMNSSFINLEEDMTSFRNKSQIQKDLFEKENPEGIFSLLVFSIKSSGTVFTSLLVGVFNAIIILPATVLGVDLVVISVLSTMIIIIALIGLWKLYK